MSHRHIVLGGGLECRADAVTDDKCGVAFRREGAAGQGDAVAH